MRKLNRQQAKLKLQQNEAIFIRNVSTLTARKLLELKASILNDVSWGGISVDEDSSPDIYFTKFPKTENLFFDINLHTHTLKHSHRKIELNTQRLILILSNLAKDKQKATLTTNISRFKPTQ